MGITDKFQTKKDLIRIGILMGFLETLFVVLVTLFMDWASRNLPSLDNFLFGAIILLLLVLGVAISGILVFGYPALLAIERRFKEAILMISVTLITLLILGLFWGILALVLI